MIRGTVICSIVCVLIGMGAIRPIPSLGEEAIPAQQPDYVLGEMFLRPEHPRLRGIAFLGNDRILSLDAAGHVALWNLETQVAEIGSKAAVLAHRFAASSDGNWFATFHPQSGLLLWRTGWSEPVRRVERGDLKNARVLRALALNRTGSVLAYSTDGDEVVFFNTSSNTVERRIRLRSRIKDMTFSPTGKWLVAGLSGTISLRVLNTGDGSFSITHSHDFVKEVGLVRVSPNEEYLLTHSRSENDATAVVEVLSLATGKSIIASDGMSTSTVFAAFTPDSQSILAVADGGELIRIGIENGQRAPVALRVPSDYTASTFSLSNDGTRIAAGGCPIGLFDISTGRCLTMSRNGPNQPIVPGLSFSEGRARAGDQLWTIPDAPRSRAQGADNPISLNSSQEDKLPLPFQHDALRRLEEAAKAPLWFFRSSSPELPNPPLVVGLRTAADQTFLDIHRMNRQRGASARFDTETIRIPHLDLGLDKGVLSANLTTLAVPASDGSVAIVHMGGKTAVTVTMPFLPIAPQQERGRAWAGIALAHDGSLLAILAPDRTRVVIWDVVAGRKKRTIWLSGEVGKVPTSRLGVAFSKGGDQFVVAYEPSSDADSPARPVVKCVEWNLANHDAEQVVILSSDQAILEHIETFAAGRHFALSRDLAAPCNFTDPSLLLKSFCAYSATRGLCAIFDGTSKWTFYSCEDQAVRLCALSSFPRCATFSHSGDHLFVQRHNGSTDVWRIPALSPPHPVR